MSKLERRSAQLELRSQGRKLEGYAALFNNEARIADFVETIRAGAFAGSLDRDVLALVDHDPGRVLARTRSKTLRLAEDTRGLAFDLDVPATSHGNDVLALAERGDLGGMSFGFTVAKDGEAWTGNRRELRAVTLHEISVVSAWPAYQGTIVNARARENKEDWLETCIATLLEDEEALDEEDARLQCLSLWGERKRNARPRTALARRYLELIKVKP
jgi:HK97 family phage prohead protease